jgi:solute:Na+ symporter, SSS family
MLHTIDWVIICLSIAIPLAMGVYLTKRASRSIDEYFLGGHRYPWYILGLVGMGTYVDMSGTMFQVSYFYMLGVKGYWVAYEGSLALFLAFLMVFMGKWLSRSRCMTNADLLHLRFGHGIQAQTARLLSAITILVMVVCFLAYIFVGTAKFLPLFIPISFLSPNVLALLFYLTVGVYTVSAGFHGVVWTDIFQVFQIFCIVIYISVMAFVVGTPEYFAQYTTPEWHQIMLPSWKTTMPIGYEHMQLLGVLIIAWLVANTLQGFATPFDAWTSQKFYSARDARDSSLLGAWWIFLFSFRFPLMMGFGVLAVGIAGKIAEPELALPVVIMELVPVGIKGVLIAAMIAAAMSTLSGMMNSSAAYFVNDIYHPYINKKSSPRHLVKVSHITTAAIVFAGIFVGWQVKTLDSIWGWIIMGLLTGTLPPNIAKWFWWRFNGIGFAMGSASGFIGATAFGLWYPSAPPHEIFAFVIVISTLGTIVGCALGKPTDMDTLVAFYKQIRPFGFWGPVRKLCDPELVNSVKKESKRDLLLLIPACLWQLTLFWFMTVIVVKKWDAVAVSFVVILLLSVILYKYWYKNLESLRTWQRRKKGDVVVVSQDQEVHKCASMGGSMWREMLGPLTFREP